MTEHFLSETMYAKNKTKQNKQTYKQKPQWSNIFKVLKNENSHIYTILEYILKMKAK